MRRARRREQQLLDDLDVLRWLHAEARHHSETAIALIDEHRRMAAVRKAERDKALADLEAVERSAAKWQHLAQSLAAKPGTVKVERVHVDGHGLWSAGAISVLIDEYTDARAIVGRLRAAQATAQTAVSELHKAGMCHPVQEAILCSRGGAVVPSGTQVCADLAKVALDALAEAGHVVVELPPVDVGRPILGTSERSVTCGPHNEWTVGLDRDGELWVSAGDDWDPPAAADLRSLAAACLAVAAAAEAREVIELQCMSATTDITSEELDHA